MEQTSFMAIQRVDTCKGDGTLVAMCCEVQHFVQVWQLISRKGEKKGCIIRTKSEQKQLVVNNNTDIKFIPKEEDESKAQTWQRCMIEPTKHTRLQHLVSKRYLYISENGKFETTDDTTKASEFLLWETEVNIVDGDTITDIIMIQVKHDLKDQITQRNKTTQTEDTCIKESKTTQTEEKKEHQATQTNDPKENKTTQTVEKNDHQATQTDDKRENKTTQTEEKTDTQATQTDGEQEDKMTQTDDVDVRLFNWFKDLIVCFRHSLHFKAERSNNIEIEKDSDDSMDITPRKNDKRDKIYVSPQIKKDEDIKKISLTADDKINKEQNSLTDSDMKDNKQNSLTDKAKTHIEQNLQTNRDKKDIKQNLLTDKSKTHIEQNTPTDRHKKDNKQKSLTDEGKTHRNQNTLMTTSTRSLLDTETKDRKSQTYSVFCDLFSSHNERNCILTSNF